MTSKLVASRLPCPSCTSSDAYHEYDDGHGFCFSCRYYKHGNKLEDELSNYTYEYLPWRGISKEIFKFYDVKTKIDPEGKPVAVGFKYPSGAHKVRYLDQKSFSWVPAGDQSNSGLFGRDKFDAGVHKYLTITEGELDALSLYQVLGSPVVSVKSAASAAADVGRDRQWVNSYERIYLAFDGDAPGREATAAVARLFDFNKVYHVKFTRPNRKDPNDYVANGEISELRNLWHNSRRYLPEQIISSLDEFKQVLEEDNKPSIPYPFPTLNEMTYGIRTGESVLLTAQEGVGKTELMHAIEYSILKGTSHDVNIAAIFLEEPKRRHLQALSGLELQKPAHLPDSGCTQSQTLAALEKVVGKDDRLHVYSHFGSDDPESLLDTIRFLVSARSCNYVLLDHITMAVSGLAGEDERRALDYLSTRLEMMVKELDFALILVSHVNDEGLTRGSRYISKIADIRIDATRDVANPDVSIRNLTYLTVSKNRFSGRTGPAGVLRFNPETYSFREETEYADSDEDSWRSAPVVMDQTPLVPTGQDVQSPVTG
jgi:twinkle protein